MLFLIFFFNLSNVTWYFLYASCASMFVCCRCVFFCVTHKQAEDRSGSMKRSVSTVADQRVNGLWQEEKSPERMYRPRHKSYKAAGESRSSHSVWRKHIVERQTFNYVAFMHWVQLFGNETVSIFLRLCTFVKSKSSKYQRFWEKLNFKWELASTW